MEEHLVSYGVAETQRLGSTMVNREITACLDETFHPEVCLVGIEPASNFILVETYSERRIKCQLLWRVASIKLAG